MKIKGLATALIAALVLTVVSVFGVFAASARATATSTPGAGTSTISARDIRELNFDRAWLARFKANTRTSRTLRIQIRSASG